jgi:hypothetical protein
MVVVYIVVVTEPQPYTIMLFPFYYIVAVYLLALTSSRPLRRLQIALIVAILTVNAGAFVVRNLALGLVVDGRDHAMMASQLRSLVPSSSRVVADYRYYYAIHNNGMTFNPWTRGAEAVRRQEQDFDYDYLVVPEPSRLAPYRTEASDLVLVGTIEMSAPSWLAEMKERGAFLGSKTLLDTYDGYVYARLRQP